MRISQDNLIEDVINETCLSPKVVKDVLLGLEKVIVRYLTKKPLEKMTIDLWTGFKINRYYQGEKDYSKGAVKNIKCAERVVIKPTVSRKIREKINKKIFG